MHIIESSQKLPAPPSLPVLTAIFPGEPWLAIFIKSKNDGSGGNNWSYKSCKAPVKSPPPTEYPVFLQAGCPSVAKLTALKGNTNSLPLLDFI